MSIGLQHYIENLQLRNGVRHYEKLEDELPFEQIYIAIRTKENRLYDDEVVKKLPYGGNAKPQHEWKLRAKSAERVSNYFKALSKEMKMCNGFIYIFLGLSWIPKHDKSTGINSYSFCH